MHIWLEKHTISPASATLELSSKSLQTLKERGLKATAYNGQSRRSSHHSLLILQQYLNRV